MKGIIKTNKEFGRYELNGKLLSCGDRIKIYEDVDEEWLTGRIEYSHTSECYYFIVENDPLASLSCLSGYKAEYKDYGYENEVLQEVASTIDK